MAKYMIKVTRTYETWVNVEADSKDAVEDALRDNLDYNSDDLWNEIYSQELEQMGVNSEDWTIHDLADNQPIDIKIEKI